MATKRVAVKLSVGSPPSGSIFLDDLLRRYLVKIGIKRFSFLSIQEIKQFALLSVFRVVTKYGLRGATVEDFGEWIRPDTNLSRIRLLPDTQDGHAYNAVQEARRLNGSVADATVVLRGVEDVKLSTSKIFIRLIIDEIRTENRQTKVKKHVTEANRSLARKGSPDADNCQPLDEIMKNMREQRAGANLDAMRFVMRRVEQKMPFEERRIVQLLNDGYKSNELAGDLDLDVTEIYAIYKQYKANLKDGWKRLFDTA